MKQNKHCNHYIVYSDDEQLEKEAWIKADEFLNGFETFFDLNEALSRAIVAAKSTGVPFVVQPRNSASIDCDSMTNVCIVNPTDNSVRQLLN
jgi:hypothetical protein